MPCQNYSAQCQNHRNWLTSHVSTRHVFLSENYFILLRYLCLLQSQLMFGGLVGLERLPDDARFPQ